MDKQPDIKIKMGLKGKYRLIKTKKSTGEVTGDTGWFDNLVVNSGLDRLGTDDNYMSRCVVGTSSAAVLPSNTNLGNQVAVTSNILSSNFTSVGVDPYGISLIRTFRFGEGEAEGNLTEVGISWETATPATLFSRALIVDSEGAPTTLTVLSDEFLDVIYELRIYPASVDDITGNVGGYDYVLRPANVASWYPQNRFFRLITLNENFRMTNGSLGAITGQPSGTSTSTSLGIVNDSYIPGSFSMSATITLGLTVGNLAGGITCANYSLGASRWQVSFDPAIDKDDTKVATISVGISWGNDT